MVKNGTCTNGNLQRIYYFWGRPKELNEKDVTIKGTNWWLYLLIALIILVLLLIFFLYRKKKRKNNNLSNKKGYLLTKRVFQK